MPFIFFLLLLLIFFTFAIHFNRDCGTENLVKRNENICTQMNFKAEHFHAYAFQMTMVQPKCDQNVSSYRMSHIQRRRKNKKGQQQADNNRFVFVSFQNIFVCILLAYLCDPLLILRFDFNSCARRILCVCAEWLWHISFSSSWNATDAACVYMCETSKLRDANNKYSCVL